jgi:hypothetical protein
MILRRDAAVSMNRLRKFAAVSRDSAWNIPHPDLTPSDHHDTFHYCFDFKLYNSTRGDLWRLAPRKKLLKGCSWCITSEEMKASRNSNARLFI